MKKLSSELFFEHVFAFFFFAARSNLLGDMVFLGDMDPFLVETSETGVATLKGERITRLQHWRNLDFEFVTDYQHNNQ